MDKEVQKKGSELIVDSLIENDTEFVFGYPGGCVIPLFDALHKRKDQIEVIRPAHEQAATHAADGYARTSGKVGVVVVTSGPGATNAVTGAATAQIDAVPLIIISGQVKRSLQGSSAFQEVDAVGISKPVTKKNYLLTSIEEIVPTFKEAFTLAVTGRPGVIWIDIPVDIQTETITGTFHSKAEINLQTIEAPESQIKQAWEMLSHAKRPILYIGGGANKTAIAPLLRQFVEKTGLLVTSTLLGLGAIDGNNPLFLGMLGMHGEYTANKAMQKADLVLVLGARFDDRVASNVAEFIRDANSIHVDIDAHTLNRIKKVDLAVHSDLSSFLQQILVLATNLHKEEWVQFCLDLKKQNKLPYFAQQQNYTALRPEAVVTALSEETKGDAIVVTDVGQNQMFTALYYKFTNPLTHITSGGFGTMGYSLPAAIGISLANPNELVISISGDGGFQMNIQELVTVKQYELPIVMCIFNNGNLGMVKQWQDLFWQSQHAATILETSPDFILLAKAYGIAAVRCSKEEELKEVISHACQLKKPIVIEFIIDSEAHVYPMIPAGGTIKDVRLTK